MYKNIIVCLSLVVAFWPAFAIAQDIHDHTPAVSGVPQGVPFFCARPNVESVASGSWSDSKTWSTGKVPAANDKVRIAPGHTVTFDATSDARLDCIEVDGVLRFATDQNTRLKVVNLTVMDQGTLEVGTTEKPVATNVTAEIIIADQTIDKMIDPAQLGTGIEGLGKVSMHGSVKTPTFVRLAKEPLQGDVTLVFDQALTGWKPGDRIVIPDTRQLRDNERGVNYEPQDEALRIAEVSGNQITLATPLRHNHRGAHGADGKPEFLPHVGNVSRNVVVRSENPDGTRGHMIFMSHASVDLRYVEVRDMGRTKMGVLDNSEFDDAGRLVKFGTNQIGRYAIHFHHDFGPKETPSNGYQFTLIGNSVDGAPKWGITVHNSHYGLVRDNVVYNTRGAGIVTEDGTESFNVFDHNFAMRAEGSGDFAPRSGYGGPLPDPGGEGAGFWFRGPNNYIRNNVAANADAFGFGLAVGALGVVHIPAFKGADTSHDAETVTLDTTGAPVLEFSNNEAYGAMQAGVAFGWNGTISNLRAWHTSRHGLTATPADKLVVDRIVVRGDPAILARQAESPAGIWLSNYVAKTIVLRDADVQGMRTGVSSPFYQEFRNAEPGRGDGSVAIEGGYFRNYIDIVIATVYSSTAEAGGAIKKAAVRDAVFEPLNVAADPLNPPAAISMNYRMAGGDPDPRDPISIYNFNKKQGENFKVYYSFEAPEKVAPCHDTRPDIGGWVCK
jgi:G8 domain-containing protein